MYVKAFLLTLSILLFITVGLVQDTIAQSSSAMDEARRISGDNFAISTRTTRGANVYAVNRPSQAVLNAIDNGLANLFAVARKNGYRRKLNFANYTIFIARADRIKDSQGNYSPDIAVGAAQYAGTEYDKGGYIYAAGMVIEFNPGSFLIAEHTQNFGRVSNAVRFEGEHLVLYNNDRSRFNQTADHSRGGGHPILQ